ncbi:hypothetical protein HZ326_5950 [Fusarium oxysporum f. sp. albedinis]|nr:hypothetical protein HZ326_5950 [Fusarium oxysporum f. sp. albedinis]
MAAIGLSYLSLVHDAGTRRMGGPCVASTAQGHRPNIDSTLTSTQQLRQSSRDVSYPWNFRSPAAANTNNCRFTASCSAGHPLFPSRSSLGPGIGERNLPPLRPRTGRLTMPTVAQS